VAYLDLNQIEKIKRKGKTNTRIKEKGKEAHNPAPPPRPFGPAGPIPRARLSPLLSLPWRARPSLRPPSPRPRPLSSLSLLAGPGCQLLHPRVTAARAARCRGLRAHVARGARNHPASVTRAQSLARPLPLPHLRTCRPLSRLPHAAHTPEHRRRPEPVSPSTSEPRRALCHGELRLDVRNPGHAPIPPPPL
jgi:hypothetical protein